MQKNGDPPPRLLNAPSQRSFADLEFASYRRHEDGGALARVVDATSHRLLSAARACTGDLHLAEELVQSTYLAAMTGARSYDARHPLLPWMIGILHNRARRARKLERRRPDPQRLHREVPMRDPGDDAVGQEFVDQVRREVAALPELYRPVVNLHIHLGMTPAEIATAVGRPRSTVRTQLSRGLRKLRAALRAYVAEAS